MADDSSFDHEFWPTVAFIGAASVVSGVAFGAFFGLGAGLVAAFSGAAGAALLSSEAVVQVFDIGPDLGF